MGEKVIYLLGYAIKVKSNVNIIFLGDRKYAQNTKW